MDSHLVGSITASVKLDYKPFDAGLRLLQNKAMTTSNSLNKRFGAGMGEGLKRSINQLSAEFKKLTQEGSILEKINEHLSVLTGGVEKTSTSVQKMKESFTTSSNAADASIKKTIALSQELETIMLHLSNRKSLTPELRNDYGIVLKRMKEQYESLDSAAMKFKENASVLPAEFNVLTEHLIRINQLITQMDSKLNHIHIDTSSSIKLQQTIDKIGEKLLYLGQTGKSVSLQLKDGFVTFDASMINTEEKINLIKAHLEGMGEEGRVEIASINSQLNTLGRDLAQTSFASKELATYLKGAGETTGVFAIINGEVVELKSSMVATDKDVQKLIMDLRKMRPEEIKFLTEQLQVLRERFGNVDATVMNLVQKSYELSSSMSRLSLGITPLAQIDGRFKAIDISEANTIAGMERIRSILQTLHPSALETVEAAFTHIETHIASATEKVALFRETLGTMNIPQFNAISSFNSNTAAIEKTVKAVQDYNLEMRKLGTDQTAFVKINGELIKIDSSLAKTKEGVVQLEEIFKQLTTPQLNEVNAQLERSLANMKRLTRQTTLFKDELVMTLDVEAFHNVSTGTSNVSKSMSDASKSTEKTKNALDNQKRSVNALDTAYGILRRTLSLVVVMFGFQLALELFNVGKEAMDASYKIKTLGREMGWTAQQSQKFQNQANRLQKIYPKIDMNSTAKSVAEMARVYDLTNDEATKFIETAAVFNSAMVKEGRSTEDASLALKDYLDLGQGWNRRMQEIGATKEQLVATGYWDGETQDINAQIKALDAYLKKRHYYQMAKEIYTLDEAYQALQLRLGMFIGQGLQALTPYIISAVKGFLSLLDAIEGVGNSLKGNPIFEAVTMFLGIAVSVGILSKGLAMLKIKLAETAVSFLRVFTLNPHLVAIALAIAAIVTVVYELGKAFGWWKDIPSMIDKITQSLGTLQGQLVAVGTAIGGVLLYFGAKGWITESNMIVKAIQKVIDKLKDYIKNKRKAYDIELPDTEGKGKGKGKTKTPDLPEPSWKEGKYWETVKNQYKEVGMQMFKASAYVAAAMLLMAEAIALMVAPMVALAGVGMVFKGLEPQIRAGIEGLQLIAPIILAFTPPIILLMYASQYLEKYLSWKSFGTAILSIIAGLVLVATAIGMLFAPMLALAGIGALTTALKSNMEQAVVGIKLMSDALLTLVPVLPIFMTAIGISAALFTAIMFGGPVGMVVGGAGFLILVASIVTGMFMVGTAINMLKVPMKSIANLGSSDIDIEGVKKGAEAIKQVSIALQYLSDAMNSVASIVVADLAMKIANYFGGQGWTDLAGSMKKVEEATDSIQTVAKTLGNLTVPDINQEEIKKLGQVAEATKNIKSALDSISGIMNQGNIVSGFTIDVDDKGAISVGVIDIVKELKAKMGDINKFINAFNNIEVPAFDDKYTDKINRIKQVVEAVKQITSALKGIGDIGTSGGIAGGLSWVIWGDLASKYGILFQNIKSTVTFVRRVSQEIKTDNINGEAINRLKNVISHIPYIVNTMNTVRTALNPVKDDAGVRDKFDIIKNNIIVVVNRVRDLLASVGDTSSINADSISRINNITQGVVNIVNKVKELRNALNSDEKGTDVNIGQKLGNIFLTLQYVQNFINAIMWNFGANGGATGDISTVLSTFSNALSQITGIASKVNALNTTLPEPNNDMQLQQKLYRLLQNIMVIKRFMSQVNWNVSKDGGAKGTGATEGMTSMVNALSTAINNLAKTCDGAVKTLKGKGEAMGNAISNGFKGKVNDAKSAVSGLQKTIGSMASYACNRADDMSVHFNTTATRIRGVAVQVQNVIDKLNSLPSSKDVNVNVNYHTNGGGFRAGFNLPTFGLGLSGIHNTVSSGFGGVIRGIRGLKGVKTLSAPVGGGFVDAFKSVIGGMRYSHYYGSKNNGNVTDTLNSGESNCVDGALATLQLARMFGLDGKLGTTMVNGEGHAFAIIEGKIFDATAMQLLGRTKAPNVRYSASNPTQKDKKKESKKEINIIVDMTDSTFYGDEDFEKKAEKLFNRLALELLDVDKHDGV